MFDMTDISMNYPEERRKISDGTYPLRIVPGRQRKHIPGTKEFEDKQDVMQRKSPGSKPAVLETDANAFVKKYKGTGEIRMTNGSDYPREIIDADFVVGKTWVQTKQKYVNTKRIMILYSGDGVHIVPVSDYKKG